MSIETKFNILVVDDDQDTATSTKMLLERNGFRVDVFFNPKDVISIFKPRVYDLALIDIRMSEINGFQLSEYLAARDEKMKICFMTAYDFSGMMEARNYGSKIPEQCIFRKPVSPSKLVDLIQKQLERK